MDNVDKAFGAWDNYTGDERVQSSTSGFLKLKDGDSVTLRIASRPYRYYTIKEKDAKMPMKDKEAAELIENRGMDDIFGDQELVVGERYGFIVYNRTASRSQLWTGVSQTTFDSIAALNKEAKEDGGIMAHDIQVTRKGESTDTKYLVTFKLKSEDFTEEQQNACLDENILKIVPHAEAM